MRKSLILAMKTAPKALAHVKQVKIAGLLKHILMAKIIL